MRWSGCFAASSKADARSVPAIWNLLGVFHVGGGRFKTSAAGSFAIGDCFGGDVQGGAGGEQAWASWLAETLSAIRIAHDDAILSSSTPKTSTTSCA